MEEELKNITPDNLPLKFVKQYLRVDHDLDDLEIAVALRSAQAYVRKYIKIDSEQEMDLDLVIPILSLTAFYYENKTAIGKSSDRVDSIIAGILDLNRGDIL